MKPASLEKAGTAVAGVVGIAGAEKGPGAQVPGVGQADALLCRLRARLAAEIGEGQRAVGAVQVADAGGQVVGIILSPAEFMATLAHISLTP